MPGTVAVALVVLAVIPLAVWSYRSNFLQHGAGADPQYIKTGPDRARYCSMGAIVLHTARAVSRTMAPMEQYRARSGTVLMY